MSRRLYTSISCNCIRSWIQNKLIYIRTLLTSQIIRRKEATPNAANEKHARNILCFLSDTWVVRRRFKAYKPMPEKVATPITLHDKQSCTGASVAAITLGLSLDRLLSTIEIYKIWSPWKCCLLWHPCFLPALGLLEPRHINLNIWPL